MPGSDFDGRLAVVTGGASGIGAQVARNLAARGAQVVIADLDESGAQTLAATIGAQALPVDVCERQQVAAMFSDLPEPPAVLVTCAGGAPRRAALDVDEALLQDTLQLNTGGFWRCAQEAARRAIDAGTGLAIVHVASSLYRGPAPELSHFAAAKAASVALVRCLAQELAGHRIRVNCVVPGPVETPMTTPVWDAAPGIREAIASRLPLGAIGEPTDVAPAITWLASDEAAWVTGAVLHVDGGLDVAP